MIMPDFSVWQLSDEDRNIINEKEAERLIQIRINNKKIENKNWKFRKEENGRKLICKRKVEFIGSQSVKLTTNLLQI